MEQQFQNFLMDPVESLGIGVDEAGEVLRTELPEQAHEETAEDSVSTRTIRCVCICGKWDRYAC